MTQPVLRLVQIPLNFPYRAIGQAPGLRSDLRNEPSAFRQRHFLCSMVWLPERIIESLHEMHALAAQNHRLVPFEAHGHERSPTRMRAKSYRHTFHGSLPVGEKDTKRVIWRRKCQQEAVHSAEHRSRRLATY